MAALAQGLFLLGLLSPTLGSASPNPAPLPAPAPPPAPGPAPFLPPFNFFSNLLFGGSSTSLDDTLDSPHKKKKKCACRRLYAVHLEDRGFDVAEDTAVELADGSAVGVAEERTFHHKKPKKPCDCYGAPHSAYGAPHSSYGAPHSSYGAPSKKCKPKGYHGRKRRSIDDFEEERVKRSPDDFNFGSDGLFNGGGFGGPSFGSDFDSEFHTIHKKHKKKRKKKKCH